MGSSMSEPMGEEPMMDDPFGDESASEGGAEKPFDDEPFDAGVEADEATDPEKYIQQLSGKLGQSLRSYSNDSGEPDYDLEKFAINSVLSATHSGDMDENDQSDIIQKVKTSGKGGDEPSDDFSEEGGEDPFGDEEGGEDSFGDDGEISMDDIDMEEGHNPNPNGKTVFQDMTLGVEDGGMEENKYLNLENEKKSSIFAESKTINKMVRELIEESPEVKPLVKPKEAPVRVPRRKKPWVIPEQTPDPEPKADALPITYISSSNFSGPDGQEEVKMTFDVGDVGFTDEVFTNTGECVEKPTDYDEPWVYVFETEPLSNRKVYSVTVDFYGHPTTDLVLSNFSNKENPEIEEVQ